MAHLLEVENLTYHYGNIKALHGLNFYVDEGEIVTLIGTNGAGKTTTMHTLAGLNDPRGASGSIVFEGRQIRGMGGHRIAGLHLTQCLEGRQIFSQLTVAENLAMGAYLRKDTARIREDTERMFRRFPRLEERKNQLGGTLSGGEQQMLAIARALMAKPKILCLDEPSLGLAPVIIHEVFQIIEEIAREGMTIFFVEQNTKMALKIANRGYVLQTGEIVMEDTCEALLHNEEVQRIYLGSN